MSISTRKFFPWNLSLPRTSSEEFKLGAHCAVETLLGDIRRKDLELAEAKQQIAAYQVRVDNDERRAEARDRTIDSLMRECADRDGYKTAAHPVTADNDAKRLKVAYALADSE